jgi:ArsR family transcriptional regulator
MVSAMTEAVFLEFFKALANVQRLRVAGAIAAGPRTVTDVAATLGMSVREVMGHLGTLVQFGFAHQEGEGAGARYTWDEAHVRALAAEHLDSPRARALGGANDERARVLASFMREGRLIGFPTGETRKQVILEYIAERFEPDRVYTEREVNAILKEIADDYATIRRALVDRLFLNRHQGVYWAGEGEGGRPAP